MIASVGPAPRANYRVRYRVLCACVRACRLPLQERNAGLEKELHAVRELKERYKSEAAAGGGGGVRSSMSKTPTPGKGGSGRSSP